MYFLHESLKEPIKIRYEVVTRTRENNQVGGFSKLHCKCPELWF